MLIHKLYLGSNSSKESKYVSKRTCQNVSKDFVDIIVLGDSHARNLYDALKKCFPEDKLKLASVVSTPFPRVNFTNPYIIDKYKNNKTI